MTQRAFASPQTATFTGPLVSCRVAELIFPIVYVLILYKDFIRIVSYQMNLPVSANVVVLLVASVSTFASAFHIYRYKGIECIASLCFFLMFNSAVTIARLLSDNLYTINQIVGVHFSQCGIPLFVMVTASAHDYNLLLLRKPLFRLAILLCIAFGIFQYVLYLFAPDPGRLRHPG
ncbi:hypothetical protein [Singulisphaera sp. PoT]|uniref:hypothetical protein n=1 Tax=Singulisphaera sp. PoT TaxID=3411797 RepID=UPI003BF60E42